MTQLGVRTWLIATAIVASAALLYVLTAARDITVGDSPELITVAVTLGVAHPPGYPLFTMLGHLFSLLPLQSIPFRVNLFAAACHALTVGVIFLTALRLCRSRLAAAVAALVLATNVTFWTWSLVAEVFPLNDLIASLLIYLLVCWHEQPERRAPLIAAAFLAGLGLTNHQTIILLAPAICFLLWRRRAALRVHALVICVLAFTIGLLPYAYVPWASAHHPEYNWGNVSSLHDLLALIARRSYGSARLVSTPGYSGGSALLRILVLFGSLGWLGGVLSLLGAVQAFRRQRWYAWFVLIALICVGPFFVSITNLNLATAPAALFVLQRFFLLSHVVIAPLGAFGVLAIVDVLSSSSASHQFWKRVTAIATLFAIAAGATLHYRHVDQSRNFIARTFAEDLFSSLDPGTILLVAGDGIILPLVYIQQAEHAYRNVSLVVSPLLAANWYVEQLRARYPQLHIPFDHYDGRENNLKMLVEANPGRPICLAGRIGDDKSLDQNYWPRPHGLVSVVEPKSDFRTIEQIVADNEPLLRRYRPPSPGGIRADTFEQDILVSYAWPAFRIAEFYRRAGLNNQAKEWREKALAIDPNLPQLATHDPK